ncbi:MAG: hypothetical protein GJU72_04910 [Acidithiobacillus ferriphilus]|nr:hypothetical protein [Acidithiobacillus ferriphilus]
MRSSASCALGDKTVWGQDGFWFCQEMVQKDQVAQMHGKGIHHHTRKHLHAITRSHPRHHPADTGAHVSADFGVVPEGHRPVEQFQRLEPIGYIPPAEAESNYYRQLAEQTELTACT